MSTIILTRGVRQYRATIPSCVSKTDTVLEIGCATGTTSARLFDHAGCLVAIDKGQAIQEARRLHPQIRFEPLDGFDIDAVRRLGLCFSKVYIDISGSRRLLDVVKIATLYEAVFRPELIVVKSTRLRGFVGRCRLWSSPGEEPE